MSHSNDNDNYSEELNIKVNKIIAELKEHEERIKEHNDLQRKAKVHSLKAQINEVVELLLKAGYMNIQISSEIKKLFKSTYSVRWILEVLDEKYKTTISGKQRAIQVSSDGSQVLDDNKSKEDYRKEYEANKYYAGAKDANSKVRKSIAQTEQIHTPQNNTHGNNNISIESEKQIPSIQTADQIKNVNNPTLIIDDKQFMSEIVDAITKNNAKTLFIEFNENDMRPISLRMVV